MTINFDYHTVTIGGHTGYGNGSRQLISSLKSQGDHVSPGSSLMLNFCMPKHYKFAKKTIGYTPWESTEVPENWLEPMERVDELWSCTQWSADILANASGRNVEVVPLGLEKEWVARKRTVNGGPFTFIHAGEPACRKGGDLVLAAWQKRFANNPDFRLIYKCIKFPMCRVKDPEGSIVASPSMYDNVTIIGKVMTVREMVKLYHNVHCMVYPTRGEGFGLIPFEAIGTGLPTLVTNGGGTADFANYGITLDDLTWVESGNQNIHPGLWIDHSVDEIIDKMLWVYHNYDNVSQEALNSAQRLHEDFAWKKIGEKAHRLLSNHL